jgi:hypothetical protein
MKRKPVVTANDKASAAFMAVAHAAIGAESPTAQDAEAFAKAMEFVDAFAEAEEYVEAGRKAMRAQPSESFEGMRGEVPAPEHDPVNHPSHYTSHPSGVECIEITEHFNFCIGNAIKYLWRAGLKGDAIEDLRKAAFYVDREITRVGGLA